MKELKITLSVEPDRISNLRNKAEKIVHERRGNTTDAVKVPWWQISDSSTEQVWYTNHPQVFFQLDQDCIKLGLTDPIFFENQDYDFYLDDKNFVILHTEFLKKNQWKIRGAEARYTFKSKNNVGWHNLPLPAPYQFRFLAFPTKMDYSLDYDKLFAQVDEHYPLWLLSLDGAGHQASRTSKPHERFWLLWLKQFESLWDQLNLSVKRIIEQPHNRLLPEIHHLRADRIKGRLHPKLEERIAQDRNNKTLDHKRYLVEKRTLQVDTPENRFIKHVLKQCRFGLNHLQKLLAKHTEAKGKSLRLGTKISEWNKNINSHLLGSLFSQVGDAVQSERESLVLQQRSGYSDVYRIYGDLRKYLELFGSQAELTLKSIDQLYEVWCLLEIKRILVGDKKIDKDGKEEKDADGKVIFEGGLDFKEASNQVLPLKTKGFEKSLNDGLNSAFELYYPAKENWSVKIRLAHEPVFGPKSNKDDQLYLSYATIQKPDIVLEATFRDRPPVFWVFDAKYRVFQVKNKGSAVKEDDYFEDADNDYGEELSAELANRELVPPDAINQMHRYRDALIHRDSDKNKSRPTLGAFCLYPGYYSTQQASGFENSKVFPYANSIQEIGIGAFPLLPGMQQGDSWIKEFLSQQLLGRSLEDKVVPKENDSWHLDHILQQDYVNIPPRALYLNAAKETVLVVWGDNHPEDLIKGSAKVFYANDTKYGPSLKRLAECRYLAVLDHETKTKIIAFYEVNQNQKPKVLPRSQIPYTRNSTWERSCRVIEIESSIQQFKKELKLKTKSGWFCYAELGDLVDF